MENPTNNSDKTTTSTGGNLKRSPKIENLNEVFKSVASPPTPQSQPNTEVKVVNVTSTNNSDRTK